MALIDLIKRKGPAALEKRADKINPKHPRDPVLAEFFNSFLNPAVTPDTAMRVSTVYACVTLIAETLATLPKHVTQLSTNGVTSKLKNHPLYPIVHDMPWQGMTSFEWFETQIGHTALQGDSFARIIATRSGEITALEPLPIGRMQTKRNAASEIIYEYSADSGLEILLDHEVLRIPYKMFDGTHSLSPIRTHRAAIGNALSSNAYLEKFLANSAQPKGALIIPDSVNSKAAEVLKKDWEERHKGPENAGRIAILDAGMKWEQIGLSMADAQYIDLLKFSVGDIARIFLVPPHKVGEMSGATFSNIEHAAIEFVVDTILHWVRRVEARFNHYTLSAADRAANIRVTIDLKGLLRGDSAARANFYKALFFLGAINPNEIRAREDMNPIDGGEQYFVNAASVPLHRVDEMIDQMVAKKMQAAGRPGQGDKDDEE